MGELGQFTAPAEVGAGIARMAEGGFPTPHQCADRRGAHAGQRFLVGSFVEHIAVGTDEGLFQKSSLLPCSALGVLLLKHLFDDIAGPL